MKIFQNNKGFSLLEVVIALAIFSISIIALYTIQTRTINQNVKASRVTTGSTWASEKIESLMALKYDEIKDSDTGKPETSPDGAYEMSWKVIEDKPLPNTKTIQMVVITPKRIGTGSKVELEYIKHKGI